MQKHGNQAKITHQPMRRMTSKYSDWPGAIPNMHEIIRKQSYGHKKNLRGTTQRAEMQLQELQTSRNSTNFSCGL